MSIDFPTELEMIRNQIASKYVNDFFLGIKNKVVMDDFLQLLIQLKNKGKVDEDIVSSKDDRPLTNAETASLSNEGEDEPLEMTDTLPSAQCFVFFLVWYETSSTTISCCLHELAVNPDIQERLRKEVDTVLINHGGQITYEDLQELKFMDAVVDETLCKYPPVGSLARFCTKACQIPGTNVNIDKETSVFITLYAIHHDSRYYLEPEKLDPERLLDENIQIRPKFIHLPLGEGPRISIAYDQCCRFGCMEVKVGLTALLSKYKFSVCETTSIPVTFNPISFITLRPRDIHLKISHRDN
uniref:Cytochrome P450 n=1 Tax=Timema shepardi TaxID=629360 RepID=A0A7R9B5F9_TIMSH|nr:unnamed protein product [Timema shepardi]